MSRIRYIKPGFFENEELAECDPLARILFAGLWTEADRDGRLEDRPRRLKAKLLPYDECDVDALLQQLADRGFIIRYESDGDEYIAIPQWYAHQRPHQREVSMGYPEPPKRKPKSVDLQGSREKERTSPEKASTSPPLMGMGNRNFTPPIVPPTGGATDERFSAFWDNYPRKVGKVAARKAWKRLKNGDQEKAVAAAATLSSTVLATNQDLQFVPHPATFINKRSFEDWAQGPPPGYGGNGGHRKDQLCPRCESTLTYDEGGEHCPMCEWRKG